MSDKGLTAFIVDYIEGRKQPKLEAFDKEAEKRLAGLTSETEVAVARQELAEQRRVLEKRYSAQEWLTDAASRAGQISLVTHALKFTHSDAKGSSIFAATNETNKQQNKQQSKGYLSTATLSNPAIDAVGNAAVLDVAKLLQTEHEGDSLIASLNRGDFSALAPLAANDQQLALWVDGFKRVLANQQPSSHKLAKQLYFPVGAGEYHLLSPLFSSSLAQALHDRIVAARFSDQAKEVGQARRKGHWHGDIHVSYPDTAVLNIGGTKPQNISYLNSVRGGKTWLLSCAAPTWQSIAKPPLLDESIFRPRGQFSFLVRDTVREMQRYLVGVQPLDSNLDIRQKRQRYVDEIIDILFNYVAEMQNMTPQRGWSGDDECKLKPSQQLWLDPYRANSDKDFAFQREGGEWKKQIADDFGRWLNDTIRHEKLNVELAERREWASVFRERLRVFEEELPEVLS